MFFRYNEQIDKFLNSDCFTRSINYNQSKLAQQQRRYQVIMAERLVILICFWVTAGKYFRQSVLRYYKRNDETEYKRLEVVNTDL